MKENRRRFLKNTLATAGVLSFPSLLDTSYGRELNEVFRSGAESSFAGMETDEDFWSYVQQSFTASPNILNLNNGGVCPQPKVVQDAFERFTRICNEGPAYYMWNVMGPCRESVRKNLALLGGCSAEEVAIVRNTTEALETVIFGMDLKRGDEVVLTRQDYPNMINAWKQREKREGIVLKWISLPQPVEDDDLVVNAYAGQFTARTRVVQIMHMINWTGQILPVKKIAAAAHARGIEVISDSAHTFAHLNFKIPDLDCDYLGTSLHKWLFSPFGTGMLFVKKDKIKKIWPLTAPENPESDDIRKFESMGTRSFPAELAIGTALEFHNMLGAARKEARLRFLREYWMKGIGEIPGVRFYTSMKPEFACGLGNFAIEGIEAAEIQKKLFDDHKIFTISIEWENIHGIRVTPNVCNTLQHMDRFIDAVHKIAAKK